MKFTERIFAVFALLALLHAASAFSQVVTGAILGRVTDTSGAVVPGATVQMQNVETGFSRNEQTDASGRYLSRNLPLGTYSITVQQSGFRSEVRQGIVLSVASEVTVNVELAVGNVQEKVEVTAEAPAVETTNATVSGLVTPEQMRDLPLNGRNVEALALLTPGAIANPYSGGSTGGGGSLGGGIRISVSGSRRDALVYLLDGTVVNDAYNSGPASLTGQTLGVEGILEFRLLTHSFSAEYGRNSGAVLSEVTRSGTNDFHGSAYEFVRNNIFDARNVFNPGALPPFRRNQFGAALGGRVIKDRIFFFANYEGLRQRQGTTLIAFVPDANARQGLVPCVSSGAPVCPSSVAVGTPVQVPFNPVIRPYLDLYPLPNFANFGDGTAQYITSPSIAINQDYSMARMDFRLSDKDSFYSRNVYDPSTQNSPTAIPGFVGQNSTTNYFVVLSESHIFSGSSLNEFRFGFNRGDPHSFAKAPDIPALAFVPGQALGGIQFSTSGVGGGGTLQQLSTIGPGQTGALFIGAQNLFQETDTFSTVRGSHSLKFGVDIERIQLNITSSAAVTGFYSFGGLLPLLAVQPTRFTVLPQDPVFGPRNTVQRGWRRDVFGWFVQDDFRVGPKLTLNLGLRYEFHTSPNEVNGRSARLIHITDPTPTIGPPFETRKNNFSPRFGLAWDPRGNGKTSVRLGGGMFYNFLEGRAWAFPAERNSIFSRSIAVNSPPFPNGLAGATILGQGLPSTYTLSANPPEPTVIHYNLEVQRELMPRLSLRIAYVGAYGYHMAHLVAENTKIPTVQSDGTLLFGPAAQPVNPNFADIFLQATDGHYNYHGLQMALQKSLSAGLQFQVAYTYSKTMSDTDEITNAELTNTAPTPLNPQKLSTDYSLSAYDQRQTIVLNGSYQMPWDKRLSGRLAKAALGGWGINGIYSYGSGLPVNIQTGFNRSNNGDSFTTDRPNLAPGASNNPTEGVTAGCQGIPAGQKLRTASRWFDPCSFVLQTVGTYGNLARNTVTGPGLNNLDFTIVKTTPLTEAKRLEFRAEFFNLFNHARLGLPTGNIFVAAGTRPGSDASITLTTGANRQIQLGLKLTF